MARNKIPTEPERGARFYFAGAGFSHRPSFEGSTMKSPKWLKPTLYEAAGGAIALAVVGFSWGGWVTGGLPLAGSGEPRRSMDFPGPLASGGD